MMLETIDPDDKLEHLFKIDIEFDEARANPKTLMYNELYTPIFKKDNVLDPIERFVFQLYEALRKDSTGNILSYKYNKKLTPPYWKKSLSLFILNI